MPLRPNKLLAMMRAGKVFSLVQMYFASNVFVELMGTAGVDVIMFDGEHGVFSPGELDDMCRVAEAWDMATIARVPDISYAAIQTYLDRGVKTILGPNINTKADAQQLVNACRYPPRGKRGTGGAPRAIGYRDFATPEVIGQVDRETMVIAFLESPEAEINMEEILTVEGIDAYYVGVFDYSLNIGFPGQVDHPRVKAFADRLQAAAEARGKFYFGENVMYGDRATNIILDGAKRMLEKNKARL